jgi:hypothetical protein
MKPRREFACAAIFRRGAAVKFSPRDGSLGKQSRKRGNDAQSRQSRKAAMKREAAARFPSLAFRALGRNIPRMNGRTAPNLLSSPHSRLLAPRLCVFAVFARRFLLADAPPDRTAGIAWKTSSRGLCHKILPHTPPRVVDLRFATV